jgi:ABC-2 type transport system ATP-binding protein
MKNEDSDPVLEVVCFGKKYGEFVAVDGLNFEVRAGEIVGMVGANGAGKTTTLQALAGLSIPTTGTLNVCGQSVASDPLAAKKRLAYIPDSNHPYDLLTVREHLKFVCLAYGVSSVESKTSAILEEMDLVDKADVLASALSRGMVQKLSLAAALIWNPAVIVLDEPLTGLDPRGIRSMKDLIRARAESGIAFLLSSHLLELVESICHRVLILDKGKRIAFGPLESIRESAALGASATMEDVYMAMTVPERTGE